MIRRAGTTLEGSEDVDEKRVVLAGGAKNFRPPTDCYGRAANDFTDVTGIKLLRDNDTAVLSRDGEKMARPNDVGG